MIGFIDELDLLSITSTRMQARAFGSGFSFLAASEVHFGEQEKMKNSQQRGCWGLASK
jgi:hypothetical protein